MEETNAMPQAETTALIEVTQLPVIEERLRTIRDQVIKTAEEAKSLVATEDTIQAVKTWRADLRKRFDGLEAQRKAVKAQIMAPYTAFEATYKECVADPIKEADASLKATIDAFEGQLKQETRDRLEAYFHELCTLENIDWLDFDKALALGNIKISMADTKRQTPRQLQDAIGKVVATVACDRAQIRKMEDAAEIFDEYTRTFNVGQAVGTVADRKRRIREAQEAEEHRKAAEAAQAEAAARVQQAAPEAFQAPQMSAKAPEPEKTWPRFTFTVKNCTRAQLLRIRDYLRQEGIEYE